MGILTFGLNERITMLYNLMITMVTSGTLALILHYVDKALTPKPIVEPEEEVTL